jgi:hypothetical protein
MTSLLLNKYFIILDAEMIKYLFSNRLVSFLLFYAKLINYLFSIRLVSFLLFYAIMIDPKGEGGILFYVCPSFRPSKIFFVAFFSVTVDGRNQIFGHKLHIGIPYCG